MPPIRAIALLVSLAILLAGPVSSLAALVDGDCCCTEAVEINQTPADSCCEAEQAPIEHEPCRGDNSGQCPNNGECCVSCSALGPTDQLNRPLANLYLPEHRPDTFSSAEPRSHAFKAHFSLLRPPRI